MEEANVFTKEKIIETLSTVPYATLVTKGQRGMNSRTMTFGYIPNDKIFFLTHKGTTKLNEINFSKEGLIHLSILTEEISYSLDISIAGTFEFILPNNPIYQTGINAVAKKKPQVKDMMASEGSENNYDLIELHITRLEGWNYIQVLSGQPKTVVI